MIIIRLLFIISGLFLLLVVGFSAALWLKIALNMKNSFLRNDPAPRKKTVHDNGKIIQGEYKIIDETLKD
jgi:uncharacterized protein YxeA